MTMHVDNLATRGYIAIMAKQLTEAQLEAMWQAAGRLDDRSMTAIIERALDGDEFCRRLAAMSARDVDAYRMAVSL